jgi:TolB-like protein
MFSAVAIRTVARSYRAGTHVPGELYIQPTFYTAHWLHLAIPENCVTTLIRELSPLTNPRKASRRFQQFTVDLYHSTRQRNLSSQGDKSMRAAGQENLKWKEPVMASRTPSSLQRGTVLASWKEIAAYLNRGLRTVQRWEKLENLPVHRHIHEKSGSIYGYKMELDAWLAVRCESSRAQQKNKGLVLAVLPFDNLGASNNCQAISDGLTEEIITQIALLQCEGLAIVSRSSVQQFRERKRGADRIALQLKADFLLEGTIRREGAITRVTTQLVNAARGTISWAKKYESTEVKTLILQGEIAALVARSLAAELSRTQSSHSSSCVQLACA